MTPKKKEEEKKEIEIHPIMGIAIVFGYLMIVLWGGFYLYFEVTIGTWVSYPLIITCLLLFVIGVLCINAMTE